MRAPITLTEAPIVAIGTIPLGMIRSGSEFSDAEVVRLRGGFIKVMIREGGTMIFGKSGVRIRVKNWARAV